jgi:hypothetical protein
VATQRWTKLLAIPNVMRLLRELGGRKPSDAEIDACIRKLTETHGEDQLVLQESQDLEKMLAESIFSVQGPSLKNRKRPNSGRTPPGVKIHVMGPQPSEMGNFPANGQYIPPEMMDSFQRMFGLRGDDDEDDDEADGDVEGSPKKGRRRKGPDDNSSMYA